MSMIADSATYRGPTAAQEASAYIRPHLPGAPGMVSSGSHDSFQSQPAQQGWQQSTNVSHQSAQPQPQSPMLDVRVVTLEKGRKDLTVRLQARTNLPHYRQSGYPSILRTYREVALLCFAMTLQHPTTIVQALPIPFPSLVSGSQGAPGASRTQAEVTAMQHQEDIFLSQLQRWFQRTIADSTLLHSPELRNFVESEYSYHPTPPDSSTSSPALKKRFSAGVAALSSAGVSGSYGPVDVGASALGLPSGATSSGSSSATAAAKSLASSFFSSIGANSSSSSTSGPTGATAAGGLGFATSRSVHDEDDELVGAREEVTRLEMQFAQAAHGLEKLSNQRRAQCGATAGLSARMTNLAALEEVRPPSAKLGLPHALGCTGEMLRRVTDLEEGQSRMEVMTLGDMLAYQSLNARSAKEAMLSRNALVEEHFMTTKLVAAKKQSAELLRGAANLRPDRVDDALQEYAEAREREREVAIQLQSVSQGLKGSLRRHSKFAHADLEDAIVAHGKDSLRRARITLEVIRGLKPEIRRAPQQGQRAPILPTPADSPQRVAQQIHPSIQRQFSNQSQSHPSPAFIAPPAVSTPPGELPAGQPVPVPVSAATPAPQRETPNMNGAAATPAAAVEDEAAPPPTPSKVDGLPQSATLRSPTASSPAPTLTVSPAPVTPSGAQLPGAPPPPQFPSRPSPFASMSASTIVASPPPANPFAPNATRLGAGGSPANPAGMAKSMFIERPPPGSDSFGAGAAAPNPFTAPGAAQNNGIIQTGGLNSGRSRISARDAAKSLAGKF